MTNRLFVLVTVAAIVSAAGMTRAEESSRGDATPLRPAARSTRGSTLVGQRVAVDVGAVVELPSETAEPRPPALRDVAIGGAQFTEVSVASQETPLLVPSPKSHFEGNVEAVDSEVLTVRLLGHSQVITVPREAITSLKIRQRHSRAGKGALIGAGVGLATGLGLVVWAASVDHCSGEDRGLCNAVYVGATTVLGAGGAAIGAVAGALSPAERWERVDPRRLSIAVMPDPRGGVRGRLAVRF